MGFLSLLCLLALISGCGSPAKSPPAPWGSPPHESGPIRDGAQLRSALAWGEANARIAPARVEEFYTFTVRDGDLVQRTRVQTRWSRLALHAAGQKTAGKPPDPAAVEGILKGPSLTVVFTTQDFQKDLMKRLDMVLVQDDRRFYAPQLRRSDPRPVTKNGRLVAFEGDLEGDFPLEALEPKQSVTLEIRREDGTYVHVEIPLWRLK